MRFVVSQQFFDRIPDAIFGVVSASGFDNRELNPAIEKQLNYRVKQVQAHFLTAEKVHQDPAIKLYQMAFDTLAINQQQYPVPNERLLLQTVRKQLNPVTAIDDLCHQIALAQHVPIEVFDSSELVEQELAVQPANGSETFIFDRSAQQVPYGEIIYASKNIACTRNWNTALNETTQITPQTQTALFTIEGFQANKTAVLAARDELVQGLREFFGVNAEAGLVEQASYDWHD